MTKKKKKTLQSDRYFETNEVFTMKNIIIKIKIKE